MRFMVMVKATKDLGHSPRRGTGYVVLFQNDIHVRAPEQ
jgi:hypothetical protein